MEYIKFANIVGQDTSLAEIGREASQNTTYENRQLDPRDQSDREDLRGKMMKIHAAVEANKRKAPKTRAHIEFMMHGDFTKNKEFYKNLGFNVMEDVRKKGKAGEHKVIRINMGGPEYIGVFVPDEKTLPKDLSMSAVEKMSNPENPKWSSRLEKPLTVYPHNGFTIENPVHYQIILDNMKAKGIKILNVNHATGNIIDDKPGEEAVQKKELYEGSEVKVIKQRMFYIMDPSNNIIQIKWYPDTEADHKMPENKPLVRAAA